MRVNKSVVWDFFSRSENYKVNKKATCLECNENVKGSGNTTNFVTHLRTNHESVLAKYLTAKLQQQQQIARAACPPSNQQNNQTSNVSANTRSQSKK
jgi:hypothetical protein